MKRIISAILVLMIVFTIFPGSIYCSAPGVWVLADKTFRGYSGDGSLTTEASDGSVVETIISGENKIIGSVSWSNIPSSIPSGQAFSITLTARIDEMKWETKKAFGSSIKASIDGAEVSPGFMSSSGYYLTDLNGEYSAEAVARDSIIEIGSDTITVSGSLREGKDGDRLAIIFTTSLNGGAKYIYEFSADPNQPVTVTPPIDIIPDVPIVLEPEVKEYNFQLSGVVLGLEDRPMRNMRIIIDPSFGESFTTKTDSNGYYSYTGRIKPIAGTEYSLKMQLQFAYMNESLNPSDGWIFYLKSSVEDPIRVETTMQILPEQLVNIPDTGLVINKEIKFSLLDTDNCISYSAPGLKDTFYSQSPKERIYGYTNVYDALTDALYTGISVFNERDTIASGLPLIVNVDDTSIDAFSHFDHNKPTGYINLKYTDSTLSDTTRSVTYHEFGHFLDYYSNGKVFRGDISSKSSMWDPYLSQYNDWHNGFLNSDSSFAVVEGYATWYASMVRKYGLYPAANYYVVPGITNLGSKVTKAWRDQLGEEFAIASFYTRLEKGFGLDDMWKIMKIDRENFYETYKEILTTPLGITHKSKIQNIAFGLGLFSHPVGNGELDSFEYFIDLNENGSFDQGSSDVLMDLMYDDRGNRLSGATKEAILQGIGRTSDSVRLRDVIPTTYQYENMYIRVDKEVDWNYVRIAIFADNEEPYAYIADITENGIYIPLPIGYSGGYVEISVPGGAFLWSGNIDEIIDHYYRTIGTNNPIATIYLDSSSLPPPGGVVEPIEGNIEVDGYYILLPYTDYYPSLNSFREQSEFGVPEYSLEFDSLGFESSEFNTEYIDLLSDEEMDLSEDQGAHYIGKSVSPVLIIVLSAGAVLLLVLVFIAGRKSGKR